MSHNKRVSKEVHGSCCCGAISYTANSVQPLWYCHCQQCRKMTGHFMAAAQVDLNNIEIQGEPKWHYVSEQSRHGFCADCGAQLFWRNDQNQFLSITGGSIDSLTDLEVAGHVFTGEKGHYYDIHGDEPRFICWNDSINHA